jgi:hypothetical protein
MVATGGDAAPLVMGKDYVVVSSGRPVLDARKKG